MRQRQGMPYLALYSAARLKKGTPSQAGFINSLSHQSGLAN
jgi:hypothetical protein